MRWHDFSVTVMGLGIHGGGIGAARYFAQRGAHVIATDLKGEKDLLPSLAALRSFPIHFVLGEHRKEDFENRDLIIRSPAIPETTSLLVRAREAKIPVETDASLACHALLCTASCNVEYHRAIFPEPLKRCFLIGVSGTKGKTTTTTLIATLFAKLKIPVLLTGTPGTSVMETIHACERNLRTPYVIAAEFSSWQLESLDQHRRSPPVAIMTSFFPDHLNRHKTMQNYKIAKATIFRYQKEGDVIIAPKKDQRIWADIRTHGTHMFVGEEDIHHLPPLTLPGAHNRTNAALAVAAVQKAMHHRHFPGHVRSPYDIAKTLSDGVAAFPGVPGRLERIAVKGGRVFINDTTATNPGAALAALTAVQKPIVLIAGGEDKSLDYRNFASAIAAKAKYVVLLQGTASDKIREAIPREYRTISYGFATMREAFAEAMTRSANGDTVLLSPGAASFNMFQDEFDRGNAFRTEVHALP